MFCVMIYSFVISLHPRFKQFWPPRARRAACAAAGTHGLCALVAPDALLSLCSWWFVVGPQQRLHGGRAGRWRILPWYTGVCGHPLSSCPGAAGRESLHCGRAGRGDAASLRGYPGDSLQLLSLPLHAFRHLPPLGWAQPLGRGSPWTLCLPRAGTPGHLSTSRGDAPLHPALLQCLRATGRVSAPWGPHHIPARETQQ